jgi:hypothetical protein
VHNRKMVDILSEAKRGRTIRGRISTISGPRRSASVADLHFQLRARCLTAGDTLGNKAIRYGHLGNCLLHTSVAIRLFRGTHFASVGLGKMDQAAPQIVDDLIDSVICRVSARVGIGHVRRTDDCLRFRWGIRAHPRHSRIFAKLLALFPMDATRRGPLAHSDCLRARRCLSAKLDSVASSCMRGRNTRLLVASHNLALI